MIRHLSVEQILSLHQSLVGHLNDAGVRDLRALESAVARPAATFETEDLFPTIDGKAAALLYSLITAAPFEEATRETALLAMECFLIANGATLRATDAELDRLGGAVAAGDIGTEALAVWIRQRMGMGR
jgi:death-on-curing protein